MIDMAIKLNKNSAETDFDRLIDECDSDDITVREITNFGKNKNLKFKNLKKKLILKPIDKINLEISKKLRDRSYNVYRTNAHRKDKYRVRLHKSTMMTKHHELESDNLIEFFKHLDHNEDFEFDSILAGRFIYDGCVYVSMNI
jgi:hypothetical protein